MKSELLESLCRLSLSLQTATKTARQVGREDLVPGLRSMGWTVAEMIAAHARSVDLANKGRTS